VTREETITMFVENAKKAAAEIHQVSSVDEVNNKLEEILQGEGAVYCSRITELEKRIVIPETRISQDFVHAAYSVDEVNGAIAETGSLISTSQSNKAVQSNLLPSHHVAIIQSDNIYASVEEYLKRINGNPPTNITFETGPSRTADIELTLTIGVHGPERLTIILV
jgi:L-lactate dehydrogenase complex protein LldG